MADLKPINNKDKEILKDIICKRNSNKYSADRIREKFSERAGKEFYTKIIRKSLYELGTVKSVQKTPRSWRLL